MLLLLRPFRRVPSRGLVAEYFLAFSQESLQSSTKPSIEHSVLPRWLSVLFLAQFGAPFASHYFVVCSLASILCCAGHCYCFASPLTCPCLDKTLILISFVLLYDRDSQCVFGLIGFELLTPRGARKKTAPAIRRSSSKILSVESQFTVLAVCRGEG